MLITVWWRMSWLVGAFWLLSGCASQSTHPSAQVAIKLDDGCIQLEHKVIQLQYQTLDLHQIIASDYPEPIAIDDLLLQSQGFLQNQRLRSYDNLYETLSPDINQQLLKLKQSYQQALLVASDKKCGFLNHPKYQLN